MKLPNPNEGRPYDSYYDKPLQPGQKESEHEYGVRKVDGHEELVHLQSGKSNMDYWKPEPAHDPNCAHQFNVSSTNNRDIECSRCGFSTTFHPGRNIYEENGVCYVYLQGKRYTITSITFR